MTGTWPFRAAINNAVSTAQAADGGASLRTDAAAPDAGSSTGAAPTWRGGAGSCTGPAVSSGNPSLASLSSSLSLSDAGPLAPAAAAAATAVARSAALTARRDARMEDVPAGWKDGGGSDPSDNTADFRGRSMGTGAERSAGAAASSLCAAAGISPASTAPGLTDAANWSSRDNDTGRGALGSSTSQMLAPCCRSRAHVSAKPPPAATDSADRPSRRTVATRAPPRRRTSQVAWWPFMAAAINGEVPSLAAVLGFAP
jgi:hypothetical protein